MYSKIAMNMWLFKLVRVWIKEIRIKGSTLGYLHSATYILGNSVKQFFVLAGASIGEMSCCALSPGHSLSGGAELGSRCTRENTIPLASLEGPPQNSLVVMLFISVVIEARCCSMQLLWGLQQYCCACSSTHIV